MPTRPLAEIIPPNLINFDRNSYVNELIARIKLHEDFKNIWDGELYQNPSQLIIQMFSYIAEKNAESFDRKLRENFLQSAQSPEAILYNLEELDVNIIQSKAAQITLEATISDAEIGETFSVPVLQLLTADLNGFDTYFEIIPKLADGTYDYFSTVEIDYATKLASDVFRVSAYAGQTQSYTVTLTEDNLENADIITPDYGVIEGSVKVYFYDETNYYELPRVTTFSATSQVTEIFPDGIPMYQLRYTIDNQARIIFGSETFGNKFDQSRVGNSIIIFYRTGGGFATNIPTGTLSASASFNIKPSIPESTASVSFVNITDGTGGANAETIEDAKIYAPLRKGRNKQIVDIFDAKDALSGQVTKHKIDAPTYAEEQHNNIPLFHIYHWLIPFRPTYSTNNTLLPTTLTDLNTAKSEFLENLNNYLNVQGLHSEAIVGEVLRSSFLNYYSVAVGEPDTYNFVSILDKSYPLSGSLILKAYNTLGEKIDQISWQGNYIKNQLLSNSLDTESATVSSAALTALVIVSGINDRLEIKFDTVDFTFIYTLESGTNLPENLVSEIQISIVQQITQNQLTALYDYIYHEFVSWDSTNKKIVFTSPTSGINSKVIFTEVGTGSSGFLTLIGITADTYISSASTGIVFDDTNSSYSYANNEVKVVINDDTLEEQSQNFTLTVAQDSSSSIGPILEFQVTDSELNQPLAFKSSKRAADVLVEFKASNGNVLDYACFTVTTDNIVFANTSIAAPDVRYVLESGDYTLNYLDLTTASFYFQLKHPTSTIERYEQSFETLTKIEFWELSGIVETLISTIDHEDTWDQDETTEVGPKIILDSINFDNIGSKDYFIKIFGANNDMICKVVFNDTGDSPFPGTVLMNPGIDPTRLFLDVVGSVEYNTVAQQISIQCNNGTLTEDEFYLPAFNEFSTVTVTYDRKNYKTITADYIPNPYHPEDEAQDFMLLLNAKSKRILGIENILKTVLFTPIKLDFNLYVKKTYQAVNAKNYIIDILYTYFTINSINFDHDIGQVISIDSIIKLASPSFSIYGITYIEFTSETQTMVSKYSIASNEFWFLLDSNMLQLLKKTEEENTELSGLMESYLPKINIISVEA